MFPDCSEKSVLRGNVNNNPYFASSFSNILTEGTEIISVSSGLLNYWLTNAGASGPDARLVLHLGCEKTINGFYVRNTVHGGKRDRGTRDFSIFSGNSPDGPWDLLIKDTLEDPRSSRLEITFFFHTITNITVEFVMFQIDTFYGPCGGLQYFSENKADLVGETYSG